MPDVSGAVRPVQVSLITVSDIFHPLEVLDVRPETADAVTLRLRAPASAAEIFAFRPGQYLTLRADIGGEDIRRSYSICAAPADGELRVGIKRVAGGRFSSWVSALRAGDVIEAMPPNGSFTWDFVPGRAASYVAFAAGSGITPILSLLKTALAVEPGSRFTLLYGNRSSDSIIFLEELAALKNRYLGRLQVYHFLTAEVDDVELFNGRLDAPRIAEALRSLVDSARLEAAFVCGPAAMMDAAERGLIEAGVDPARILVERFTAGPVSAEQAAAARVLEVKAEGRMVQVTLDGRRRAVEFHAGLGSILESARAAGLPAPFACKAGVCATCRARLTAGKVEMKANYGLSPDEVAQGFVLTCQAVPLTDDVAVDFDG